MNYVTVPGKGRRETPGKALPWEINKIIQKIKIYSFYVSGLVSSFICLFIYLIHSFNYLILDCVGPETSNNLHKQNYMYLYMYIQQKQVGVLLPHFQPQQELRPRAGSGDVSFNAVGEGANGASASRPLICPLRGIYFMQFTG